MDIFELGGSAGDMVTPGNCGDGGCGRHGGYGAGCSCRMNYGVGLRE
jgi:hypothetical protein